MLRAALRLATLLAIVAALFPLSLATRVMALAGARRSAMRAAARVQAWWARASLTVIGIELEVEGEAPEGAVLVCANHLGYLDILVLAALVPGRFVAMHEIAGWPLFGWMARSTGTLFLDRERKRDVLAVGSLIDRTLASGVSVLIFPEGRAGPGDELRPFKSALFHAAALARVPCLPVALAYRTPGVPYSPAWTVGWWGGMGLWRHIWRLLRLPRIRALVRFAPATTAADRKVLASEVHRALERLYTPHSLEPEPPDNPWRHLARGGSQASANPRSTRAEPR